MMMKKYNIWARIAMTLFMAMMILPLQFLQVSAEGTKEAVSEQIPEKETVRIGYYQVPQFQQTDDDGLRSGFSYDYYMQIQKYTRWEYDFVEASYSECYQMLLDGEIDIMSGLAMTDARKEQMLFSNYTVTSSQNELYAREQDDELYYESFDSFDGRRVAIMRGTLPNDLNTYCERHGFSVELVEYDSPTDMYEALENGAVDMMYSSSVADNLPTKIVAHMEKSPLYYAVTLSRPDILEELDDALHMVTINNPDFYTQMSEKYMVNGSNAAASFTREELEYIRSGQKVYLIVNPDWAPISWYDETNDEYRGIFVDVVERVKEYSGLDIQICTEEEFNNTILPEEPEAENNVIAILADDNAWAVTQNVLMTNHVVDSPVVMVTKRSAHQNEKNENQRVALPNRFYVSWCMRNDFSEDQVVYYDTVEECLNAINSGQADVTYVNELVANYFISQLEYSNLFATANSGYHENLAFAVNKDSQQPLLGILDKSLLCIGNSELDEIILTNSVSEQRTTIKGLYYSNPGAVMGVLFGSILLILGIVMIFRRMHAKRIYLAEALKQDAETTAARTEFFMMISHELRTPLNAVVGYLEMAAEHCKGDSVASEYLKRSRRATKQLSNIAEDMLDYTRISSATAVLHEDVFDLKATIRGLEQNFALEAEKKNIRLEFAIHDLEKEYMLGDHLRVEQMMQNILSNAVKFTDNGGSVLVDIQQVKVDENEKLTELIFTVTDSGRGMTPENLAMICAPFQQNDQDYSRTHGGLGLGLYLTKYYLDAMGGQMEATSTLGEGSTFTIHIPLKEAEGDSQVKQRPQLKHVRAIIGTADAEEGKQLQTTLKRLGVKSDIQIDGEKLIRRITSRVGGTYAYSLCLLDEKILDDNDELLHSIVEITDAPIIFVFTGEMKNVDVLKQKTQISRVLYKPIFQSVLFDAMLEEFGAYDTDSAPVPPEELAGLRVMVVEDNKINADILTQVLKRANMQFTVCVNGKEALDTFNASAKDDYQFILMDIQMPVMNGYEASRAIRASEHPQAATIPIIAVSANAFPEDIENSMAAGMNRHLSKPIDMQVLYHTMEEWLAEKMFDTI